LKIALRQVEINTRQNILLARYNFFENLFSGGETIFLSGEILAAVPGSSMIEQS